MNNHILSLPLEIICLIIVKIPLIDIIKNCFLVSSSFNKIATSNFVWKKLLLDKCEDLIKQTDLSVNGYWFDRENKKHTISNIDNEIINIFNKASLVACNPTIFLNNEPCDENNYLNNFIRLFKTSYVNFNINFKNKNFFGPKQKFTMQVPFIVSNKLEMKYLFDLLYELAPEFDIPKTIAANEEHRKRCITKLIKFKFDNKIYNNFEFPNNEIAEFKNMKTYNISFCCRTSLLMFN